MRTASSTYDPTFCTTVDSRRPRLRRQAVERALWEAALTPAQAEARYWQGERYEHAEARRARIAKLLEHHRARLRELRARRQDLYERVVLLDDLYAQYDLADVEAEIAELEERVGEGEDRLVFAEEDVDIAVSHIDYDDEWHVDFRRPEGEAAPRVVIRRPRGHAPRPRRNHRTRGSSRGSPSSDDDLADEHLAAAPRGWRP